MNNHLKDAIIDLNEYILSLDIVKEFKYYDYLIKNNSQLHEMEERLKLMQKDIVNKKYKDEDCSLLIEQYNELKNHYMEHPYIHNYMILKEEVNELLQNIRSDINKQLEINLKK